MAVVRYAVVFAAALVAAGAVAEPVGSLAFVAPPAGVLPVTFLVSAAFSALAAVWVSNLISWGRSRARLGWVLLWTEATALVVLGLLVAVPVAAYSLGLALDLSSAFGLVVTLAPIALNATILSWRMREPATRHARDVSLTAVVAAAATLAPFVLLFVLCRYIGCSG